MQNFIAETVLALAKENYDIMVVISESRGSGY
jgi:hypothetical protein